MAVADVSVVIPTRNRQPLLRRALETVLGQRGVDVEVFVVDEGSSDGTADFVRTLGEPRVTLVRHEKPQGLAEARNAGIARARAPWVAFLDDDDFWAPTKLALQLEAAKRGVDWVCAGAVLVDGGLNVLAYWPVPAEHEMIRLLSYNCVPGGGSGILARTEVVRRLGGFDPKLAIIADWEMYIRLFLDSVPARVDRPLVAYFRHGGSMSHVDRRFAAELEWIVEKHRIARRARGVEVDRHRWLLWEAAGQLRAGNRREALSMYLRAIRGHGDAKSIVRAVLAAVAPELLVRIWIRNDLRRKLPRHILSDAEQWLAPLRAAGSTTAAHAPVAA